MSEEFESAVFEHLGAKALLGETMSLHEAFKKGWQAARELDAKRIAELEDDLKELRQQTNVRCSQVQERDITIVNLNADIAKIEEELQSNKNMFLAACESLGIIAKHLNIEPEQGGHAPILYAIKKLEAQNKAMRDALVMWDETIKYQYTGSQEAMSYLQECANETVRLIGKEG